MPDINFEHVVSFSSEDSPLYKAENLIGSKKWRCGSAGESQASIVLQTKTPVQIGSVHIGNFGSAFVEVLVGRKENKSDGFVGLLPSSSFQDPLEARNETNSGRVKVFTADKFSKSTASQKWDQVKFVCTQPFNKHTKYGLAFVTVTSVAEETSAVDAAVDAAGVKKVTKLGAFMLRASPNNSDDEDSAPPKVGNLFASFMASDKKTPATPKAREKPGQSVAGELRAGGGTLAAMTVKASGLAEQGDSGGFVSSAKKRKTAEPQASASKPNKKARTGSSDDKTSTKLPPRNVIDPGFGPKKPKEEPDKDKTTPKPHAAATPKMKTPPAKPQEKAKKSKPFGKLFEGVRFVLSGYQNPARGSIRDKALAMGATYRGDWDSTCTHLVCAFINTPKYNQVKNQSRGAKIVKATWIEDSFGARMRHPWRRHCLDPALASKPESEDEIWDEASLPSTSANAQPPTSQPPDEELDTDEEIERVERAQLEAAKKNDSDRLKASKGKRQSSYDQDTDDEMAEVKQESKDTWLKNNVPAQNATHLEEPDTDEEIERLKKEQETWKKAAKSPKKGGSQSKSEKSAKDSSKAEKQSSFKKEGHYSYDQDTDEEMIEVKSESKQTGSKNDGSAKNTMNSDEPDTDEEIDQLKKEQESWNKAGKIPKEGGSQSQSKQSKKESFKAEKKSKKELLYEEDTDDEMDKVEGKKDKSNTNNTPNGKTFKKEDQSKEEGKLKKGSSEAKKTPKKVLKKESTSGDDAYDADTDVDEAVEAKQADFSLEGSRFLLYGVFNDREGVARRVLQLADCKVEPFMTPNVDIVVTENGDWDRNFDLARRENPKVKFIRANFFRDYSRDAATMKSAHKYLISNK